MIVAGNVAVDRQRRLLGGCILEGATIEMEALAEAIIAIAPAPHAVAA